MLTSIPHTNYSVFWFEYLNTIKYREATVLSIAKAIHSVIQQDYKAIVVVDGLTKTDGKKLGASLRKLHVKTEKVLGGREEKSVFLRLADACAGLIRDAADKKDPERRALDELIKNKIIKKL